MVVPAAAPVDRVAEQFARGLADQPQALAAQVRVIGLPDLGRQVGYPAAMRRRLGDRRPDRETVYRAALPA